MHVISSELLELERLDLIETVHCLCPYMQFGALAKKWRTAFCDIYNTLLNGVCNRLDPILRCFRTIRAIFRDYRVCFVFVIRVLIVKLFKK